MTDIVKFCEPKSDQLNAADLISCNKIIKIKKVRVTATGTQDCTIWFEGDNDKPWKPCKTMGRIMLERYGSDIQKWVGKYIELFRDPEVVYGGKKEGGIRIAAMSDIPSDFETVVRVARSSTKVVKIRKLTITAAVPVNAALLSAGEEAAGKGVAAYTAWLAELTAEPKESIRPHHAAWSKIAMAADAAKTAPPTDEESPV